MMGYLFAIISGAAMSVQGVMNTRLGEKTGIYEANVFVQGISFILSVIVMIMWGKGSLKGIADVDKLYLLGGVLAPVITITVMKAVSAASPVVAISVILISQLITAAVIDAFGLMNSEKVPFDWTCYAGIALMIGGVILFKWHR